MAAQLSSIFHVPLSKGPCLGVSDFEASAVEILQDIQHLQNNIAVSESALRANTIGSPAKSKENGRHFENTILQFIEGLIVRTEHFRPAIDLTGKLITALAQKYATSLNEPLSLAELKQTGIIITTPPHGFPKTRKDLIDGLWLSWVLTFEPLGLRASKRFSAAVLNKYHEVVAWSVVRPYPGLVLEVPFFIKGKDGGRAWINLCAERATLMKALGFLAPDHHVTGDRKDIQAYVSEFNIAFRKKALASRKLGTYTLVTGQFPCNPCAQFLTDNDGQQLLLKRIVTQGLNKKTLNLSSSDRQMETSYKLFMSNNLPVSIVSPALSVFTPRQEKAIMMRSHREALDRKPVRSKSSPPLGAKLTTDSSLLTDLCFR